MQKARVMNSRILCQLSIRVQLAHSGVGCSCEPETGLSSFRDFSPPYQGIKARIRSRGDLYRPC